MSHESQHREDSETSEDTGGAVQEAQCQTVSARYPEQKFSQYVKHKPSDKSRSYSPVAVVVVFIVASQRG